METSAIYLFLVCSIFLLCEQINASSSVVNNGTTTETTALLSSDQVKSSHSPMFTGPSIITNHSSNKQMTLQTSHNAASPVGNIGTTTEMTSLLSLNQVKSSHSSMFTGLSLATKHSSTKQMMSQLSQNAASSVVKPSPSLLSTSQSVKTRHSSNKPLTSHMSPSKLASGQSGSVSSVPDKSKLITNTVPQQKTSSLIMKTSNPSTTLVTTVMLSKTSAESKSSVVMQANDYNSTSILPSPATQAVDNRSTNAIPSSSMFKVITSSLTNLPNPTLNSSSSKGNGMRGSSKPHSSTLTAAVSNVSSPHTASRTFVPSRFSVLKTTSLTPYSTLNRIKVNQTNTTNSVGNHPSSTVKVNRSISSMVFKHSSAKPLLNTSSISTMTNTNTSLPSSVNATPSSRVELHITSTSSSLKNLSHVMNSAMSSIPIQSPAVSASSVISTYNQSSTAKTGRSCYNNNTLLTCVTLQPSAPMQFTTTSSRVIMSKSLSNSVNSTFSLIVPPTTKKGSKEETHKPLIIGLAVGLSVGMILIIIIVVYYRRKRSSYQYNVFYDEQNIVMHPFDYSK